MNDLCQNKTLEALINSITALCTDYIEQKDLKGKALADVIAALNLTMDSFGKWKKGSNKMKRSKEPRRHYCQYCHVLYGVKDIWEP
ncbi:MAG: hypothetical protein GY874_03885 [Desulfobacteraceae bacterium]|nr:hypothetical protein [Desulfobacteraceae bacterium]